MKKQSLFWKTEKRRVKDLLPYERNPRVISDKQMEVLKKSLTKFNLAETPAINKDGKICAGHQRVRALILLGRGEEEIDVRVPSRQLSEAEFKEYLLTSNRSGGEFSWDMLAEDFNIGELTMSGFDDADLSHIFDQNLEIEDIDWDEKAELKKAKKTDIKLGDKFSLGRHVLICGDSTDSSVVKRLVGSVKIDLIENDLPFNIGLSYNCGVSNKADLYGGTYDDNKTDEEYEKFVRAIMENALSVAKPDCHVAFWCDERYVWLLQTLYKKLGVNSKRLLIWIKNNFSATPTCAWNKATEFIAYGTIGSPYLSKEFLNSNEIQNPGMTTGNNLLDEISDHMNLLLVKRLPSNEMKHPTEKSPKLHEKILRRCTRPGDTVLDLTAGSGSLLIACHQLKRTSYVCEKDPIFCQLIINKFKKISNDTITKIN